jgi:hypothetical protein
MPTPFVPLVFFPGGAVGPQGPPGEPGTQILHRYTYQILSGIDTSGTDITFPEVMGEMRYDLSALFPPASIPATLKAWFRCTIYTTDASVSANMDFWDVNGVTNGMTPTSIPFGMSPLFTTNMTLSQYFEQDVSSYFVGLTATQPPEQLFQARLWMGSVVAGQQAICTMAKLDLEWT